MLSLRNTKLDGLIGVGRTCSCSTSRPQQVQKNLFCLDCEEVWLETRIKYSRGSLHLIYLEISLDSSKLFCRTIFSSFGSLLNSKGFRSCQRNRTSLLRFLMAAVPQVLLVCMKYFRRFLLKYIWLIQSMARGLGLSWQRVIKTLCILWSGEMNLWPSHVKTRNKFCSVSVSVLLWKEI